MTPSELLQNKIDDYKQTIYAILGFINFYRYDDEKKEMRTDVVVFQGRKLNPSGQPNHYVTPDIGILLPTGEGVIGEVKKSFPKDETLWHDDFKQLRSYDGKLIGWPSQDGKVSQHDVVLLVHQARAVKVRDFYEKLSSNEKISNPFIIVQFNRSEEGKSYFFFQKAHGNLSSKEIDERLRIGVQVPMEIFVAAYSEIQIYDVQPPLPYLMDLIWTHVVMPKAMEQIPDTKLKKHKKINVLLNISDIIKVLQESFSFYRLYKEHSDRQSHMPHPDWVVEACEKFVETKHAIWSDTVKTALTFHFQRYDDVLEHFKEQCVSSVAADDETTPLLDLMNKFTQQNGH